MEPENRLLACTLEREWNERLLEVERVEQGYEKTRQKPPPSRSRPSNGS